jgi:hypothetical protein
MGEKSVFIAVEDTYCNQTITLKNGGWQRDFGRITGKPSPEKFGSAEGSISE